MRDDFIGTWYLDVTVTANGQQRHERQIMDVDRTKDAEYPYDPDTACAYAVTLSMESPPINGVPGLGTRLPHLPDGSADIVCYHTLSKKRRLLKGRIVEGVLVGRLREQDPSDFNYYPFGVVVGWNKTYISSDPTAPDTAPLRLVPCVYELQDEHDLPLARVWIDDGAVSTSPTYPGRVKFWGGAPPSDVLEYDVSVTLTATNVSFVDPRVPGGAALVSGDLSGRGVDPNPLNTATWWDHGVRVEVLTYGLQPARSLVPWQQRARKQLRHLMLCGGPTSVIVDPDPCAAGTYPLASLDQNWSGVPTASPSLPQVIPGNPTERDDYISPALAGGAAIPVGRDYTIYQILLQYQVVHPVTGKKVRRRVHGYLSLPTTPAPDKTKPTIITLNGMMAAASLPYSPSYSMMSLSGPTQEYWYGDAFARRGFVVFAVDMPNDPEAQDAFDNGVDEARKVCDALAAVEFLQTGASQFPDVLQWVDPQRIVVVGQSMGGRIATKVAALDDRVTACIAGWGRDLSCTPGASNYDFAPDMWTYARVTEYFNTPDLHALIAGATPSGRQRGLAVHEGQMDSNAPTMGARQLARRSRPLFPPKWFVHYINLGGDTFRWGAAREATMPPDAGIAEPSVLYPATGWQTSNARSATLAATDVENLVNQFVP